MNRILATLTVSLALIVCGLVHGRWTDRWSTAPAIPEAAHRFDKVAQLDIGEWQGTEMPDDRRAAVDPLIAATLQRSYKKGHNQEVAIFLVCGRPGPVSIHSPDICYAASGYKVGTPTRVTVPGTKATFWTATASRITSSETKSQRIYWAWNAGDGWTASDDPRVAFARKPVLHKLYIIRDMDRPGESLSDDPCQEFMQEFLRELDPTLFPQGS